jgi:uncharacterized protein (DUF4415 family)
MHSGKDMEEQLQEPIGIQIGDKIRIRSGLYSGMRGIIQAEINGGVEVLLDDGNSIHVEPTDITNYSLAARRAWQKMPKKAGRPQSPTPRKKMVSMRIDVDVWNMLQEAGERGLISNREKAVNDWIREQVILLLAKED